MLTALRAGLWITAALVPSVGTQERRLELPAFGVSLVAPAGFVRARETSPADVVLWRVGKAQEAASGPEVSVRIEPAGGRTLRQLAEKARASIDKAEPPVETIVDGEPALRIGGQLANSVAVESIVALHGRAAYRLERRQAAGRATHDELEAIRSTWKWMPYAAPANTLELRSEPWPLHRGKMSALVPAIARQMQAAHEGDDLLTFYDHARGLFACIITFQQIPNTQHLSLAQLKDAVTRQLTARTKAERPFTWRAGAGKTPYVASDTVQTHVGEPTSHGYETRTRYAIIRLSDETVSLFNVAYTGQSADELKTFDACFDRMLDSLVISLPRQ